MGTTTENKRIISGGRLQKKRTKMKQLLKQREKEWNVKIERRDRVLMQRLD